MSAILAESLGFFSQWLDDPSVSEICINEPRIIFVERKHVWERIERPDLTHDRLWAIATMIGNTTPTIGKLNESAPIGSGTLPGNYRIQLVVPQAVEKGKFSITIRVPSKVEFTLDDLAEKGFFSEIVERVNVVPDVDRLLLALKAEKLYERFFYLAVKHKKTIITCGETGSGKTTFMKALTQSIPVTERLIAIEDAPEMVFSRHENHVRLLYSREAKPDDPVTPKTLLESCMRMRPDRILLAETRGAEAYNFLSVLLSGHNGSISSIHAASPEAAFNRLAQLAAQNENAGTMSHELLVKQFRSVVDIIVHQSHEKKIHMTEIYFDPARQRELPAIDIHETVAWAKKEYPSWFQEGTMRVTQPMPKVVAA